MSEPVDVEAQPPTDQPDKSGSGGEPTKSTRQSKRRTKTGCLTCRKRRIKCGEERPTCNNCVKSKRNCEGYSQRVVFKLGSFGNEDGQIDGVPYYGFPDQMPYMPGADPTIPYALQAARGNMNLPRIAPAPFARRQYDESLPENQLHTTLPPHLQYYMGAPQQGDDPNYSLQEREHTGNIPPGLPQDPNFVQRSPTSIPPIDTGMIGRGSISLVSPSHSTPLSATESHWPASATSTTYPNIDAGYRNSYGHDSSPSLTSPTGFPLESPTSYRTSVTTAPSRPSNASEVPPLNGYNPYGSSNEHPHGYPGTQYPPDQYAAMQFKREPNFDQHGFQGSVNVQEQQGEWQDGATVGIAAQGVEVEVEDEELDTEEEEDSAPQDEDILMELDAIPRETIAMAITPYAQSNENTRLTFRSFLPEPGSLIKYSPVSGASPLSNPTTARIFCHWVYVVAPSLSIFERHPANPHQAFAPGTKLNGPQNIWCYTIPTMSLSSPLLLHALLAVASLHIAKLSDEPITSSYVHYHFSLRRLRKAISDDRERASVTTLAGTLLLAYYETMAADVRKWSSHLQGAKNLLKEIDFDNLNRRMEILEDEELTQQDHSAAFEGIPSVRNRKLQQKAKLSPEIPANDDPIRRYILGSRERRKMSQVEKARVVNAKSSNARDQEIAIMQSDLFWFFAKQDAYQALLSGEGLVLDYAHWSQCPPRPRTGTLGTSYGSIDYLFLLYGRIADFQARDAKRKAEVEKYGPAPAIIELMKSMGGPKPDGRPGATGPPSMGPPGGPPPTGVQAGPPPGWQGGPPPGWKGGPPPGWTGGPPPGWQGGPPPGWQGGPPPGMAGPPPAGMPQGGPPDPLSSRPTELQSPLSPPPGAEDGGQSSSPSANSGPKMPPPGKFSKSDLDAMTVEAELEWKEIYKALLLFQESLGDEFIPLEAELMPVQTSPFGDAIFYRTYSVSCLQALYKTANIILERCHPSMPSNGWVAAGIAARKTAALAQEMGRISAGLFPPLEATEISPPLGGALIEVSFCMLFAGVQYQDPNQREWLLDNLYNVGKMTGWGTANRCALGCEHAWTKMAAAGRGPPYERRQDSKAREAFIVGTQDTPNYVFMGSANKAHWAAGILGPMENQMGNMTLGSN